MSWQGYVDSSLVGSGHLDKAAIASIAGDSVWATSSSLDLKLDELKIVSSILSSDDNAARTKAFSDGLYLGGERFVLARAEEGTIYARSGREGFAISKSSTAIVIGHHGETHIAGNASNTVAHIAKYLKDQNM